MRASKKPCAFALKRLYTLWLQGASLRSLADPLGVRHSTLRGWFRDTYGVGATNPVGLSLAKSVLADYEDQPEATGWVLDNLTSLNGETVQHRSNHNISQLSRYQTVRDFDLMDCLAIAQEPEENSWDFLRLELTLVTLSATVAVLGYLRKVALSELVIENTEEPLAA